LARSCKIVGRETGRRLVEKEQDRIGDELHRDVHALALSAREHLLLRFADLEIANLLEAELRQCRVDPAIDLLFRIVGGQSETRRVTHRFEHGELRVHDVVLGDVSNRSAERVVDEIEILAVDPNLSGGRRKIAVERQK
jgi:hypothetical protein